MGVYALTPVLDRKPRFKIVISLSFHIFVGARSNVYTFMAITIPMLAKLIVRG